MQVITNTAEFEALKLERDVLVAYFTKDVCDVGHAVLPKIIDLLQDTEVSLATIDVTSLPEVAGQHVVFAVPTILVFVYGREFDRFSRHVSLARVEDSLARARDIVASR